MEITQVTLDGERVRLEPMTAAHLEPLTEAGAHSELWRWTRTVADTPETMRTYVDEALAEAAAGVSLPLVTVDHASGRVIGSTRFGNIDRANHRVEIGWTWITPEFQRSHVNTEAKYLMLSHAFDTWQCVRVELKTDAFNAKSRAAMLRIGATEEGTLRKHLLVQGDRYRDTVYFSILDTEWPTVRTVIETLMNRNRR
ncbi:MAG: GNAT family protein [Gemmatimonadaceae bacterium]